MKYTLIEEKGQYALVLRGESMTQYAVVSGLDKETGNWDWTCCYYDFGNFSELTRAEALFKALDYYLMRTNEKHIPWARMGEIATLMKDGLIEDGEEEAYRYMADAVELSNAEAEYFWLDMGRYRNATDEDIDSDTAPSSTGSDYGPANPWDAPGMSAPDFIQASCWGIPQTVVNGTGSTGSEYPLKSSGFEGYFVPKLVPISTSYCHTFMGREGGIMKNYVFGYARVSTEQQNLDRQLDALKKYGCDVIYNEKMAGSKSDRPELAKMLDRMTNDKPRCRQKSHQIISYAAVFYQRD